MIIMLIQRYYFARPLFERFKLVEAIREAADLPVSLVRNTAAAAAPAAADDDEAAVVAEPMRYTPFLKAITKTVILSTEPR